MSTHIIDEIAAVKLPQQRTGYYFILAMLSGDNNCIDCQSGRRSRSWNPVCAGEHWRCLARACDLASDACGGMVRMVHGKTTPESLIRNFRAALDAAPDYDSPDALFRIDNTAITFLPDEKANGGGYYYERLMEKHGKPEKRDIYLRGEVEAFPFDIREPREAARFIEFLPYKSPLWHHLKIRGPGEV